MVSTHSATPTIHPTSPVSEDEHGNSKEPAGRHDTMNVELAPQSDFILPKHTFVKYFVLGIKSNPYYLDISSMLFVIEMRISLCTVGYCATMASGHS